MVRHRSIELLGSTAQAHLMKGVIMKKLALVIAFLLLIATAHADFLDRGGGLIYDDVLDITWLQDANYSSILTAASVSEIIAEVGSVDGHTLVPSDFVFGESQDRMNW